MQTESVDVNIFIIVV